MSDETKEPEAVEAEVEVVETETVLTPEATEAIAKSVAESMEATIAKTVAEAFASKTAELEKTIQKDVRETTPVDSFNFVGSSTDIEKMSPQLRFVKQIQASLRGDQGLKKELASHAMEARTKAGYNNEGVDAEGGLIVLQPEFEAEIERLLPQYGAMVNEVNFVDLPGNSVITNKGTNVVEFTDTVNEGAAKPAKKSEFSQSTVSLNKYAAILLATTELLEDQAVDFWQDATNQFAYAYGKKIDALTLTDNGTVASKKGILFTAGTTTEPTSGAGSTVTWDDLLNAKYAVPGEAATGIFVMHRSTLNALRQLKGVSNDYLQQGNFLDGSGNPTTPWGDRIVLTDVMPINGSTWAGTTVGAGVVYGDFKRYYKVYRKAGGLRLDVSDSATVVDSASVTQNLWQNNMVGMKAEFRATGFAKFPEAFCKIGQAPLS